VCGHLEPQRLACEVFGSKITHKLSIFATFGGDGNSKGAMADRCSSPRGRTAICDLAEFPSKTKEINRAKIG
jgi:hypothetical protein